MIDDNANRHRIRLQSSHSRKSSLTRTGTRMMKHEHAKLPSTSYGENVHPSSINEGAPPTQEYTQPIKSYDEMIIQTAAVNNAINANNTNDLHDTVSYDSVAGRSPIFMRPSDMVIKDTTAKAPAKTASFIHILVLLIIILSVSIVFAMNASDFTSNNIQFRSGGAGSSAGVAKYFNKDLKEWQEKEKYINLAYEKYTTASKDGTITQLTSSRDVNYINSWLVILSDYKAALVFEGGASNANKDRLADNAKRELAAFKKTEQAFINGQPLGKKVTYTDADGNTVSSDGTDANSTPKVTDEMEQRVRDYQPQRDENGTYMKAAADIAGIMGLSMNYDFNMASKNCDTSGLDLTTAIEVYCPSTPNQIYVNMNHANYVSTVHSTAFISDLKHELSHHIIDSRCGATEPPITGDRTEGVTSSYAVLFLGASRDDLANANDLEQYKMTASTDDIANKIHAGMCSAQ